MTDADKMNVLIEALPNMRLHNGHTIVVKYGGNAMGQADATAAFAQDVVLLKQVGINPVVVHGGGPQIAAMLERLKIPTKFIDGLRVTDDATMDVVEMVLAGSINKGLVEAIHSAGGRAAGVSGMDGRLIHARKAEKTRKNAATGQMETIDLGLVGEPEKIDPAILHVLLKSDIIPVVAPIGSDETGRTLNINADTSAGAIAGALKAQRFLLLTDVPGVLDKNKQLIGQLSAADVQRLIADGTISGGMIPKVETCLHALRGGAERAVILDGRVAHAILLELFTDHGRGTMIVP